jgi:outer membrane protein assembly factor BamB
MAREPSSTGESPDARRGDSSLVAGDVRPERALLHPLWWAALATLLVNDHLLKGAGALPAAVTGKLSDFAGVFLAPALLAALVRARSRGALQACHLAVAAVFSVLELSQAAATAWESAGALVGLSWRLVVDPTDLVALPMLAASWRLLVPRMRAPVSALRPAWRLGAQLAGLGAGVFACAATSQARAPRPAIHGDRVLGQAWYAQPLHAIDLATGRPRGEIEVEGGVDPPIVGGDVVVMASWQSLTALPLAGGPKRWELKRAQDRFDRPVVDGGTVYVYRSFVDEVGSDERPVVQAVELATGRELWTFPVGKGPNPMLVPAKGGVLVAHAKALSLLDAASGRPRWTFQAPAALRAAVDGGARIYVGGEDGVLRAVDAANGSEVWSFQKKSKTPFSIGYYQNDAPMGLADGLLFFVADGALVAFDVDKRAERWTLPGVSGVVVAPGTALARLRDDNRFAALDTSTGRERWRVRVHDYVASSPIIGGGVVVIRPQASVLYAFDLRQGYLRWTFDLEGGELVERASASALVVRPPG